ncbi:MAG: AraC family transcriptional regulator [bacterium]|nr:AraC family transcriptional regulator [bacterium]
MITFFWYDIILVPGIAQGIFLSFMLFRLDKRNISANRILAIIIAMAAVMLIGRMVWARYPPDLSYQWSLIPDTTIFLFGPLIYFYIKRLLFKEENGIPFFHFIPAITHLVIVGIMFQYSKQDYDLLIYKGHLNSYFLTLEEIAIVLNIIYWILGYLLIRKYLKQGSENLSFKQNTVNYLLYLHFAILICLAMWPIGFVHRVWFRGSLSFIDYDLIWTTIPLFIYVVGYYALKQPELFRLHIETPTAKLQINRLKDEETNQLKKALEMVINEEKIYLKNDLTLSMLAKSIGASSNNVSWLLNEVYGKSFYDYINGLRIGEFIAKIENREHSKKTLLALAMEVGFNSKSTFNKAFKLEKDSSPSEYIKNNQLSAENPEYELPEAV